MTAEAYTGLMGSGKTLALVEYGLKALASGSDVYANFGIGRHMWGWLLPDGSYSEVPQLLDPKLRARYLATSPGHRIGMGFVPFPNVYRLRDWEHFCQLRVMRDPLGGAHKEGCDYRQCNGCSRGITILIDEVNSWANSRHWQDVGVGLLTKFTYMRKHGLELVVSAQHEDRLDVALRHLLEFTWLCRPGGFWTRRADHVKEPVRIRGFPLAWFTRERFIAGQLTDAVRAGAKEMESHSGIIGGMAGPERHWFSDNVANAYDTYEEVELPGNKKIQTLTWRSPTGRVERSWNEPAIA